MERTISTDHKRYLGGSQWKRLCTDSEDFCRTPWSVLEDRFKRHLYPYADSYRMKSQCIKSAWMYLILHEALGFPEERISLMTTSSVNGQSVQWSLGALLYHTRFLPLREIQLQQMLSNPTASGDSNGDLFAFLTNSSFTLPFLVVLLVAILLVLCRQKRHPTHYSLSHSPSSLSLTRVSSSLAMLTAGLTKSQSSPRLSQYS